MAVVGVTSISELKGARRLDAEYYQPAYLKLEKEIRKIGSKRLKDIAFVTDGIHSSINYDPTSPIRIISAQSVQDNNFDLSANTRISVEQHQRNLRTSLEVGDIIISSVGTIGNAAVVSANMLPSNADRHVGIVRLKNKKFNAFHVSTFLNSKYGRFQTFRESTGNVQLNLFIEKIEELLIPEIEDAEQIGKVTEQATILLEDSRNLYSQADNLLLEKLGLKDFKPKYELSYTANLSTAFGVRRIDAEYFQPIYDKLVQQLATTVELKPLGNLLPDMKKGVEVGGEQYQENGKAFIRVSSLSVDGLIERDQKHISETLYAKFARDYQPKMGELLLTKDASPGIAYVLKEPVEGIVSSGILRMTTDESQVNKEYLALCINSIIGKLQVERDGGGSVITHWKPGQIKRLQVPLLPNETQHRIASLIEQSHQARKKAKELLEEAKRKAEHAVEAGSAT